MERARWARSANFVLHNRAREQVCRQELGAPGEVGSPAEHSWASFSQKSGDGQKCLLPPSGWSPEAGLGKAFPTPTSCLIPCAPQAAGAGLSEGGPTERAVLGQEPSPNR